ncbi:glutaredoxin domain-containing protein [uncultured Stenotrophomonas sp.]|uniref:glutaredoxin domain-containing protein n=1 Tax=uncultured Stenotrophomonas sp. TaxID=165438 RepID=UPI0025E4056B|nr:glutaredoxin domain-containing protein [uncultured Stenotrophomonas sp.]
MSQPNVTVYSRPACVQCKATYMALDKAGIEYEVIDLATDAESLEMVTKELGYMKAPVVIVEYADGTAEHWSGFRPDLIAGHITAHLNAA